MTGFAAPPDPAGRAGDGGLRCQRAVFLPIPFLCQFREPGCQIVFSCKKLPPSAYRAAIARYA